MKNDTMGFMATVREDLESFAELNHTQLSSPLAYINVLMYPGVMAVLLFRLSGLCHRLWLRPISRLLYILNVVLFSGDLAPAAEVGPGLAIPHPIGVGIAAKAKIGRKVRLFMGVLVAGGAYEDPTRDGFPVIGDGCWIFSHAQVLGPIHVGDNAIVGANSVLMTSVPAGAVAFGTPARVVRFRKGYGPEAAQAGGTERSPEP